MSEFREVFYKAKRIAIITGAGVSAESGVPTFRGENEKWRQWQSQVLSREKEHAHPFMDVSLKVNLLCVIKKKSRKLEVFTALIFCLRKHTFV